MTDDDVEKIAMAMWKTADPHTHWRDIGQPAQDAWRRGATAARDVMLANGWRKIGPNEIVVPREPTDEIIKRIARARWEMTSSSDLYRAMITAKDE